ncbi:hypothetical protein W97_08230 [Coniosporium apollinis CBS 100218]|uniref:Vacuolar protein sorting-associated protein 62 n=1 Tax=Coniosporium apollinis (strain CBS 100218) TaxID=1168221 RepID=R7Z481_CONA1|nr:uncharacterized protein W97_08230 [Coniosporium apollinis CBS 100218]EON68972.1 hypothetical protein W97_08230 [Coniosporium apollinis CBS 100218]
MPSDIGAQVANTQPEVNFEVVAGAPNPLTLDNLDQLNPLGGKDVYLTSKVDITTNPAWLNGARPDSSGKISGATPCVVIVNDKGSGNVDAFYMYFWANNWGGEVLGKNLGNHVGDFEHNMIRFQNGVPKAVWYSQHGNGQAFKYSTVKKSGLRPLVYVSKGSHALYAITGKHDHTIPNLNLPFGLLVDHTDAGIKWDPLLSTWYYTYDGASSTFAARSEGVPTAWLYFEGRWGDREYPKSDPRQKEFFGVPKYSSGPTGPKDKQLNREKVCPDNGQLCIVRNILVP